MIQRARAEYAVEVISAVPCAVKDYCRRIIPADFSIGAVQMCVVYL